MRVIAFDGCLVVITLFKVSATDMLLLLLRADLISGIPCFASRCSQLHQNCQRRVLM